MKKISLILSSLGTMTGLSTIITNYSFTQGSFDKIVSQTIMDYNKSFVNENNFWDEVGIDHNVVTPSTGTHEKDDTKITSKATAKLSWENLIDKSNFVNANGYFALHTYDQAKYYNTVELTFDNSNSSEFLRTWSYDETNDHWAGWGHQTSKIKLTLTATYNSDEGITSLSIESYIYARTAGSVHECSTTSTINSFEFLIG